MLFLFVFLVVMLSPLQSNIYFIRRTCVQGLQYSLCKYANFLVRFSIGCPYFKYQVLVVQPGQLSHAACDYSLTNYHASISYSFDRRATVIIRVKYTMHYVSQFLSTNVCARGQGHRSWTVYSV